MAPFGWFTFSFSRVSNGHKSLHILRLQYTQRGNLGLVTRSSWEEFSVLGWVRDVNKHPSGKPELGKDQRSVEEQVHVTIVSRDDQVA